MTVGVALFFSIYGYQLMGPFGKVINIIGYNLFSDALLFLPWVVLLLGSSLLMNRDQPLTRYYGFLFLFGISFLTFVDSFFVHKMISNHGLIYRTMTETIIYFGSQIFGILGVRLLLISFSVISIVFLHNISFRNIDLRPSKG